MEKPCVVLDIVCINVCLSVYMDEWMDNWMYGWMDERVNWMPA